MAPSSTISNTALELSKSQHNPPFTTSSTTRLIKNGCVGDPRAPSPFVKGGKRKKRKTRRKSRRKSKRKTRRKSKRTKRRRRKNKRTKNKKRRRRRRRRTQRGGSIESDGFTRPSSGFEGGTMEFHKSIRGHHPTFTRFNTGNKFCGGMKKSKKPKTTSEPKKESQGEKKFDLTKAMEKLAVESPDITMGNTEDVMGTFPTTNDTNRFTVKGLTSQQQMGNKNLAFGTPGNSGAVKPPAREGVVSMWVADRDEREDTFNTKQAIKQARNDELERQNVLLTPIQETNLKPKDILKTGGIVGSLETMLDNVGMGKTVKKN